jgi:hypothetical protein
MKRRPKLCHFESRLPNGLPLDNAVTLFGCILPRGCGIEITILRPMVLVKSRKGIFLQRLGSFLPLKVSFLIEPQVKIRYFSDVIPTVAGVQKQ